MHVHAYRINIQENKFLKLALDSRLSADVEGIARCLGLQAEATIELEQILKNLESKISANTLFIPVSIGCGQK